MTEYKKGQRVRVSREITVGSAYNAEYCGWVADESGASYAFNKWDFEVLPPASWPPEPGDLWEANGTTFFCQGRKNSDRLTMIPVVSYDGHPTYSNVTGDGLRGYEDFKAFGPVLKYRKDAE